MNGDPTQKYRKTDTRSSIKPGLANGEAVQSAGRAGNTDCVKLNVPDFSVSSNSTLRNVFDARQLFCISTPPEERFQGLTAGTRARVRAAKNATGLPLNESDRYYSLDGFGRITLAFDNDFVSLPIPPNSN
jgi:hypothetical protein